MRIGIGYDTHVLVENRKLILGGVEIAHAKGLAGHSDADVLTHAIIDALLGAAGLPDIGNFFPDNDQKYRNADSLELLKEVVKKLRPYQIINVDSVIICQTPKLIDYIPQMKENLSKVVQTGDPAGLYPQVNVKATTTEKMNAEGEVRCISAQAVALVQ
ncbi:MAG: 2-C-methyl-D-erythritol 2,4-cyclodiphosphate synthase [Alphaproteobacteria bacterium]|nr:2-C-methyl-D-erythritol 2,4-cyclodiphosphate synthase [Alphaproteobacteria bacterium]